MGEVKMEGSSVGGVTPEQPSKSVSAEPATTRPPPVTTQPPPVTTAAPLASSDGIGGIHMEGKPSADASTPVQEKTPSASSSSSSSDFGLPRAESGTVRSESSSAKRAA